jgi:hypothetical protein
MKTTIDGVEITPAMTEILKKWFIYNPAVEESYPEYYVQKLGEMQDYFCRNLEEESNRLETVKHMLLSIIAIKDDFKKLIP